MGGRRKAARRSHTVSYFQEHQRAKAVEIGVCEVSSRSEESFRQCHSARNCPGLELGCLKIWGMTAEASRGRDAVGSNFYSPESRHPRVSADRLNRSWYYVATGSAYGIRQCLDRCLMACQIGRLDLSMHRNHESGATWSESWASHEQYLHVISEELSMT